MTTPQSVQHDLRNLFTSINFHCDEGIMDLGEGSYSTESLTAMLNSIKETVKTAAFLCAEDSDMVEMSEVLGKLVKKLRIGGGIRASVTFDFDPGAAPKVPTYVNRAHFENLIINLVKNANAAMPTGGHLTIRCGITTDPTLPGLNGVVGLFTTLEISDTGKGFPAESLRRIADRRYVQTPDGHGYGMANVHRYIDLLRGHISFESVEGKGTVITLFFPRGPTMSSILLVDDDRSLRSLGARAMRRAGYDVLDAGDAVEALTLLETHPHIDLLITDIMLPGMSGIELVAQINRPLPVLFISGNDAAQYSFDRDQSFLAKPYDIPTLIERIGHILRVQYEAVTAVENMSARLTCVGGDRN